MSKPLLAAAHPTTAATPQMDAADQPIGDTDAQDSGIRLALVSGKQLRRMRKQAGFTQRELADKLCCSQQQVAAWEAGRYRIPTYRLHDLRDVFVQSRLDARNYQQLMTSIEHWPTVGEWGTVETLAASQVKHK